MKRLLDNKYMYSALLFILLVGAIFGAINIQKFIGYAGYGIEAKAGNVTGLVISSKQPSNYWHGLHGLAFYEIGWNEEQSVNVSGGEISSKVFVFDCIDPTLSEQEMYASTNDSIDFSNVVPGTIDMVDEFFNYLEHTHETANNTFTNFANISLGSTFIQDIPAVYTYVNDAPDPSRTFFTGILNASGELLLVGRLLVETDYSYKNNLTKYQMLLPINADYTKFYFYADPYDSCPAGYSTGQTGDSSVKGYVVEASTGNPIANATVSLAGNTTLTTSTGFFNFTVVGGYDYNLISIKNGYITNVTLINTTIGFTTWQNLTMAKFYGYVGENVTLSGYVRDNATGDVISEALISTVGRTTYSNGSGNYSFRIPKGFHMIAAVKDGYQNYVGNYTIKANQNLSYIINMTSTDNREVLNGTVIKNGTIFGTVRDNSTNLTLSDVNVSVTGVNNLTDINGTYNITTYSGVTNLVATKDDYEAFFSEVTITEDNMTKFNFSMEPVIIIEGIGNGSITGTVTGENGNIITGVTVSIVGKEDESNITGQYLIEGITAGTHNLVATKTGYENYIAVVNITRDNVTVHDITMTTYVEAGLGAGLGVGEGTGYGAGLGEGKGPGTGIQARIEQPVEIREYEITVSKIIKKIRIGSFITTPITIINFKKDFVDLEFSVEGDVKELARLDKEKMILDGSDETEVTLTLVGNVEPGIYDGFFVVSGDINEKIPIYVLVLDKERLDVEALIIDVIPEKRKAIAGRNFKYRVELNNLLKEEKYDIKLTHHLMGIVNNISTQVDEDDLEILTSYSLLKNIKLPPDLVEGDYVLLVRGHFLGQTSEGATIFTIKQPFYKYKLFGIIPLWIIMLIFGFLSLVLMFLFIRKKQKEKKQRYQIEVDYNQIPKAGPRSVFIGNIAETNIRAYLDLDLFQIHTLVAGSSGSGKSIVAQILVEEALLKNASVIVFDPTAQWTGFLRKCQNKDMLNNYKKFGLKVAAARPFNGNIHQVENAREVIDFKKFMKPSEINVFVTDKLDNRDIETFVANTIREVFKSNLPESKELKYLLVYDGIHSLLPKFGGTGQVFVQIERATREFRKWGVGLILISQVISDFPKEVLANINTEIQMRTRDENDLKRVKEEYGDKILRSIVKAAVGTGMIENSAYNKGKPFFASFRPVLHSTKRVSDDELQNYNKYNRIIDDIEFQLEQLEKEKVDAFDLKLELKLAQDKLKSGSFNMVDIYIEGLKPRIQAQWSKIGKKPKKREIKYISDSELESELKKAKKDQERTSNAKNEEKQSTNVADAIAKAKQAKESVIQEKQEEVTRNETNELDALISKIHSFLEKGDKKSVVPLYSNLQSLYRLASNEDKKKILKECNLIKERFSKK